MTWQWPITRFQYERKVTRCADTITKLVELFVVKCFKQVGSIREATVLQVLGWPRFPPWSSNYSCWQQTIFVLFLRVWEVRGGYQNYCKGNSHCVVDHSYYPILYRDSLVYMLILYREPLVCRLISYRDSLVYMLILYRDSLVYMLISAESFLRPQSQVFSNVDTVV